MTSPTAPAAPHPVLRIELRPPRWWRAARVLFLVTGVLNVTVGVAIVALAVGLATGGRTFAVTQLALGVAIGAAGAFLVQQVRRTGRYQATPLVLDESHAMLPRLRTRESIRVAYEDLGKIYFIKSPRLRMRIFVRTAGQGDFFVHRAWLPAEWTLDGLVRELVQRRDAARAAKAEDAERNAAAPP